MRILCPDVNDPEAIPDDLHMGVQASYAEPTLRRWAPVLCGPREGGAQKPERDDAAQCPPDQKSGAGS